MDTIGTKKPRDFTEADALVFKMWQGVGDRLFERQRKAHKWLADGIPLTVDAWRDKIDDEIFRGFTADCEKD